jgi:hypothetical protein
VASLGSTRRLLLKTAALISKRVAPHDMALIEKLR